MIDHAPIPVFVTGLDPAGTFRQERFSTTNMTRILVDRYGDGWPELYVYDEDAGICLGQITPYAGASGVPSLSWLPQLNEALVPVRCGVVLPATERPCRTLVPVLPYRRTLGADAPPPVFCRVHSLS